MKIRHTEVAVGLSDIVFILLTCIGVQLLEEVITIKYTKLLCSMSSTIGPVQYVVGIDEVGRGPFAGPVAVGACAFLKKDQKKIRRLFPDARDSKALSEKARCDIFRRVKKAQASGLLFFHVSLVSNKIIDEKGIVPSIKKALRVSMDSLNLSPQKCLVLLDGGLSAPKEYVYQKTIIKGDTKELSIMLSAISAKVTRDRFMKRLAKRFPQYGFEINKGYGTALHRQAIKTHGLSLVHRKTFCTRFSSPEVRSWVKGGEV